MRNQFLYINFILIGYILLNLACIKCVLAESAGTVGYSGNPIHNSGTICDSCHFGGNKPDIVIGGPSSVLPDSINHYNLVMTGGQNSSGGINISINNGTLILNDQKTYLKLNSSTQIKEITQKSPKGVGIDGSTITWTFDLQAPSLIGETSNIYIAALSANNNAGTSGDMVASLKYDVTVVSSLPKPIPPKGFITAPFTAQIDEWIIFDGAKSSVQDGFILNYLWEFDDGTTDTNAQTFSRFDTLGFKTVKLTVTSNSDLITTTFIEIEVVDTAKGALLNPIAKLSGPTTAEVNQQVTFDKTGSTGNSGTLYLYDFGDGSLISTSPTHQYANSRNSYTVTLAVQEGQLTTTATTEIKITSATTQPLDTGESLYKQHCESCHGIGGVGILGVAKNVVGSTALFIDNALNDPAIPNMQGITLAAGNSQLIADFLGTDTVGAGSSLYVARCQICHGDIGVGIAGVGKNIQNTTSKLITDAISAITTPPAVALMAGIKLSSAKALLMVNYLTVATPTITGKTIYETNCLSCHGVAGIGGSSKVVVNSTVAMINNAIATIPKMNTPINLALTVSDIQLLVDYLVGQVPGDAATGELTYIYKCQMCHGTGTGGLAKNILRASAQMIDLAIATVPQMQGAKLTNLTPVEKQDIVAMLLRRPLVKPVTGSGLYEMYCSYCHGPTGLGGPKTIAKFSLRGQPNAVIVIKAAYSGGELIMSNSYLRNAGLLDADLQLIINYLK